MLDEDTPALAARPPQLVVADVVDRLPHRGIVALVSQPSPRWASSSARIGGASQVGTWTPLVTDVIGTSSTRTVTEHRLPHRTRHVTVPAADRVRGAAGPEREHRHARPCVVIRTDPFARRPRSARGSPVVSAKRPSIEMTSSRPYVSLPAGTGVWVVKTSRSTTSAQRLVPPRARRRAARCSSSNAASAGWPSFRCYDRRIDAERGQRARAAHAEHGVLREPDRAAALVEARRDPAPDDRVLRTVGVEQEERARVRRRRRQICTTTSSSSTGTSTVTRSPVNGSVTGTQGSSVGSESIQYSCCHPLVSMRWWK